MGFLGLAKSFLVRIKHPEIVQDGGNVRMLRSDMSLVYSYGMEVIRLCCFGAAGLAKQQCRVVQESSQFRVGQIRNLGRGRDRFFVKDEGVLFLSQLVANPRQPARRPK